MFILLSWLDVICLLHKREESRDDPKNKSRQAWMQARIMEEDFFFFNKDSLFI